MSSPPGLREATSPGRREARKRATKAALRQAAARLFAEQGYEATTVQQIAQSAHVGERTFYRYFGAKDDLLAEQALAWIDALHDAIRDRPAEEPPYVAVARGMTAVTGQMAGAGPGNPRLLAEPWQLMAALRRARLRPLRHLEESIAAAVMHRLRAAAGAGQADWPGGQSGLRSAEFQAELLGCVAVAALRTATTYHRSLGSDGEGWPAIGRLLADAFAELSDLAQPQEKGAAAG